MPYRMLYSTMSPSHSSILLPGARLELPGSCLRLQRSSHPWIEVQIQLEGKEATSLFGRSPTHVALWHALTHDDANKA